MSKKDYEDDGRTVADMRGTQANNIFGSMSFFGSRGPKNDGPVEQVPLTAREKWQITFSAVLAGLLVSGVFIGAFYLFIMFCLHIWFK